MTLKEFESHPLWASLRATLDVLNAVNIQNEPEGSFAKRVIFIAGYILSFEDKYSDLFTQSGLDVIFNTWANVATNSQNYVNNTQLQFLQNAKTYAENSLDLAASWPVKVDSRNDPKNIAQGYRNLVDGLEKDRQRLTSLINV